MHAPVSAHAPFCSLGPESSEWRCPVCGSYHLHPGDWGNPPPSCLQIVLHWGSFPSWFQNLSTWQLNVTITGKILQLCHFRFVICCWLLFVFHEFSLKLNHLFKSHHKLCQVQFQFDEWAYDDSLQELHFSHFFSFTLMFTSVVLHKSHVSLTYSITLSHYSHLYFHFDWNCKAGFSQVYNNMHITSLKLAIKPFHSLVWFWPVKYYSMWQAIIWCCETLNPGSAAIQSPGLRATVLGCVGAPVGLTVS